MMVSKVVDAVRASLNSEGYSTLSNAELAARTGMSIATTRRALKRAIQEGMLFSHGSNQTRRLSLVANPRTDRTRLALQIVEDAWRFGAAGYRKSQATVAEMLGVSIDVAREAFEVAIERGWLKREIERFEGADGSPRRAYLHQVTEAGKEAIGVTQKTALSASTSALSAATEAQATALPATVAAPDPSKELEALRAELAELREREANLKEALSALTSALSAEKEARAKAEEQLTQAADETFILGLLEENAALVQKNESLEREVIQLKGQLAKIEIGECEACQEREPSHLESAYIVERQLTSFLMERVEIPREELDNAMRDRIKDLSLIPHWENRFAQLDGFQVTSKDQEEEFGGDQEEESGEYQEEKSGEDQEGESDEEPRNWLLPLPELELNPFPYRVDLEEI